MAQGWTEYSDTLITALQPDKTTYNLYGSNNAVLTAWGGGAYDSKRNRQIFWGGGHGDYNGNEMYALYHDPDPDLSDCIITTGGRLGRITNPSYGVPYGDSPCQEALADGKPNSRHTYGGLVYVPDHDKLFIYGGSLSCGSGGFSETAWTFSFATKTWTQLSPTGQQPSHGSPVTCFLTYDPVTRLVWGKTGAGTYTFSITDNAWTELKYNDSPQPNMGYSACAIDPVRRRMIIIPRNVAATYYVDLTGGNNYGIQTLTTQGITPPYGEYAGGLAYDPSSDRMVSWYNASGSSATSPDYIYTLDQSTSPPTWAAHGPFSGYPGISSRGVLGKWQFIPYLNAFGVAVSGSSNCSVFQLPDSIRRVSISTGTWVARSLVKDYAPGPGSYAGKHMHAEHNPIDGTVVLMCGDHGATQGVESDRPGDSGGNEVYQYNVRTDTWVELWPYCGTGTRPSHPDQSPLAYDTLRNIYWLVSGQDWDPSQSGLCPCPTDEVLGHGWKFDPYDPTWTDWSGSHSGFATWQSANKDMMCHDPRQDALYVIWRNPGGINEPRVTRYFPATDTITGTSFGALGSLSSNIFNAVHLAHDVTGRIIWTINTNNRRLLKYMIDDDTMTEVSGSDLPESCPTLDQEMFLHWNSNSNVLHYCARHLTPPSTPIFTLYTYNPTTNTWTEDSMYQPDSYDVGGRCIVYDPYQDLLIAFGDGDPYIFLYRYAETEGTPAAPTNLRIVR